MCFCWKVRWAAVPDTSWWLSTIFGSWKSCSSTMCWSHALSSSHSPSTSTARARGNWKEPSKSSSTISKERGESSWPSSIWTFSPRRTFTDKTNDISTTSVDSLSSVRPLPPSSNDGLVHYDYSRMIVIMSAAAIGFVFICLLLLICVESSCDATRSTITWSSKNKQTLKMNLHGDVDDSSTKPTDSNFSASVALCCKIFLAIYIFFKVLYNVVLTFTALSTLFAIWMHATLRSADKVEEIRFWSRDRSGTMMKRVDEMLQGHLENDSELRSKMRKQCDEYMESLIKTIQAGVSVTNDNDYNFRSTNMHIRTKVLQDQWRNIDRRIRTRHEWTRHDRCRKYLVSDGSVQWFRQRDLFQQMVDLPETSVQQEQILDFFERNRRVFRIGLRCGNCCPLHISRNFNFRIYAPLAGWRHR